MLFASFLPLYYCRTGHFWQIVLTFLDLAGLPSLINDPQNADDHTEDDEPEEPFQDDHYHDRASGCSLSPAVA